MAEKEMVTQFNNEINDINSTPSLVLSTRREPFSGFIEMLTLWSSSTPLTRRD
jgi:hypothetical protein